MVTHGEMSSGLITVNSLCSYIFSEFWKAAAASRGDANTRVGYSSEEPDWLPPCHCSHGKCMRLNRGCEKG